MFMTQFDLLSGAPTLPTPQQFRMTQLQVLNWGTFSDLFTIQVAKQGFLFVGPSGAGKSTLLDAHATLMTPPKWVGFNMAAREGESSGHGADRNLMTYVRGAWAQQTSKAGEVAQQYLRTSTTWSALAETYTTGTRTVTIAQVFWVRGNTTDRKEIKRTYLVADRAFDVRELQPFADRDFDLKLVRSIPGVHVHDEFSGYGERLRRLMGIEQESSMRLLHKTQSAKNLGDINDFLRDFTLEPPQTFEIAKELVEHFQALREAHAAVVGTRRQIEVLTPAQTAYDALLTHRATLAKLNDTRSNLAAYKEQLKAKLLKAQIGRISAEIAEQSEKADYWRQQEADAKATLSLLLGKRNGNALAQVGRCEAELRLAADALRTAEGNQGLLAKACAAMALPEPTSEEELEVTLQQMETQLALLAEEERDRQNQRDDLRIELRVISRQRTDLQAELAELARRRSNMHSQLLSVRARLCTELSWDAAALPFAGELVDVTEAEQAWKGAAERVMRGFAEHLVVPMEQFPLIKRTVNKLHLGTLLTLYDAGKAPIARATLSPHALAHKLTFSDHPLSAWVKAKAFSLFDHVCVGSADELDANRRAVTREGLVKADEGSFRKDDRHSIDDRSKWILGGDTRAKVASLQDALEQVQLKHQGIEQALQALAPTAFAEQQRNIELIKPFDWSRLDVADARRAHTAAIAQLAVAKAAAPDLAELETQIEKQEAEHTAAQQQASRLEAQSSTLMQTVAAFQSKLSRLEVPLLERELPSDAVADLELRFGPLGTTLELDNMDEASSQVKDALAREERVAQSQATACLHEMTTQFRDYIRDWPAKAAGLDPTEASADDFLAILAQLMKDGLPQYEAKFLTLLQEQGTQEMMRLHTRLEQERKDIKSRMEAVNASLKKTAFNVGTHLVIEPREKSLPDVMKFRQDLKEAYGNYLQDSTIDEVDRRFKVLNDIVNKLESPEAAARVWRDLCLDVRRHVDFIIREFNEAGDEVEVYRSGAGKSGGQRQKLTATILAAALRYQLGGSDTGMPMYSTVFMDEAFDKADAEFTDLAMKVFETFGFQLVVATPLKSVMTLEPYIGGACFVHLEDRKHSRVVPVMYLEGEKKLDFKHSGVDFEDADLI